MFYNLSKFGNMRKLLLRPAMNINNPEGDSREGEIISNLLDALRNEDPSSQVHGLEAGSGFDLSVAFKGRRFGVVIKTPQLRTEMLLGQLSQAVLEVQKHVQAVGVNPFALLVVPAIRVKQIEAIDAFARNFIPEVSIGVLAENGQCWLRFEAGLSHVVINTHRTERSPITRTQYVNLFSDTNQWLLKVLLGEYLPDTVLSVPRIRYTHFTTAASLAERANVSTMTAGRFLNELKREGFLDTSKPYLSLMRLDELMDRWRAATSNAVIRDLPMRFLFDGDKEKMLSKLMNKVKVQTCLGLFDAASKHGLGLVSGAMTYLYVPKHVDIDLLSSAWAAVEFTKEANADIIIREAPWPTSIFKASIYSQGPRYTDLIQTWLDVSSHPTRGPEQADFIWKQYLQPHLGLVK
ncbi:hypothetical protein P606_11580 [Comamonas thiooxydans]|nr:hypothetical protein P606_11580 [Comamonas thiooxydans]